MEIDRDIQGGLEVASKRASACREMCEFLGLEDPYDGREYAHRCGGSAGALGNVLTAARSVAACMAWIGRTDKTEQRRVARELARRQEWYALAIWQALRGE